MGNYKAKVNPVKILLIILAVLLIAAAVVLAVFIYSDGLHQEQFSVNVENSFLFGNCNGDYNNVDLNDELVSVQLMEKYNGELSRISAEYFLDRLKDAGEGETAALYNAMIYAYNNGYNYISMPAALYDEEEMIKAVYYAAADLPIMDLNTEISYSDSSITLADGTVSKRYYLYLPTGTENHLLFKKQAVEEAKKLVAELPEECDTALKKAEYFHDWLVRNVHYTADDTYVASEPYYLYDTLVGRVSNSDGFSRAYTMLLNLSGVECITVYRSEGGGKAAHAWNIFKADGQYYQADATLDAGVYALGLGNLKLHFCLSADAMGNGEYHKVIKDLLPACDAENHDRDYVDLIAASTAKELREEPEMIALREKLDAGAPYVTIRCAAFASSSWEENVKTVSRWFGESKVDFHVAKAGNQTCVIYPKTEA